MQIKNYSYYENSQVEKLENNDKLLFISDYATNMYIYFSFDNDYRIVLYGMKMILDILQILIGLLIVLNQAKYFVQQIQSTLSELQIQRLKSEKIIVNFYCDVNRQIHQESLFTDIGDIIQIEVKIKQKLY
ncbi:unnamed protein product [Paramecium sonneborni]|uniref:Transmembrane protein n=1 Tax=Paramecium sonneborni TaxID=65129 RepID=A0A8S1M418_9CILI|nr:unnamed protein product [Paramecium sonneborni]